MREVKMEMGQRGWCVEEGKYDGEGRGEKIEGQINRSSNPAERQTC